MTNPLELNTSQIQYPGGFPNGQSVEYPELYEASPSLSPTEPGAPRKALPVPPTEREGRGNKRRPYADKNVRARLREERKMAREAERERKEEEDRRDQEALEAITSKVPSRLEDNLFNRLAEVFKPMIQAVPELQQSGTPQGRMEGGSGSEPPPPLLEREKAPERGRNQADKQRSRGQRSQRSRRSRMLEDSDPSSSSDEVMPRPKHPKKKDKRLQKLYEDSDLDSEYSGDDGSALKYNRVKLELELNEKEQKDWFNQMKLELQTQGFWKAVRVGMRLLRDKDTEEMDEFFQGKNSRKDACAAIIRSNINSADRRSTRGCKTAAELWNHLKEEYCQITRRDRGRAILSLVRWKMSPKHTICEALKELENLNQDVKDINCWTFEKEFILHFFVEQMPKQYAAVQDVLYGREELTRRDVIATLREKQESLQAGGNSPNDTTNRVKDLSNVECYECKETGHFKRDCKNPQNDLQDMKKKDRKSSKKDDKRKNKKQYNARRVEDSDSNDFFIEARNERVSTRQSEPTGSPNRELSSLPEPSIFNQPDESSPKPLPASTEDSLVHDEEPPHRSLNLDPSPAPEPVSESEALTSPELLLHPLKRPRVYRIENGSLRKLRSRHNKLTSSSPAVKNDEEL